MKFFAIFGGTRRITFVFVLIEFASVLIALTNIRIPFALVLTNVLIVSGNVSLVGTNVAGILFDIVLRSMHRGQHGYGQYSTYSNK